MGEVANTSAVRKCEFCGNYHPDRVCPLIKAIEYHPNGTTKRVEFHGPAHPFRLNDVLTGEKQTTEAW